MHDSCDEKQETPEPKDYFRVIRERGWIVIVAVVVVVAAALVYSHRSTPMYRATTSLVYQKSNLEQALFGIAVFPDTNQTSVVQTDAGLVKVTPVATAVKAELNSSKSPGQLLSMISVAPSATTSVISIDAVSTDPHEAARVANAFAEQFIISRQKADRATIEAASQLVKNQLDTLNPADATSTYGATLKSRYESLQIIEAMQNGGFTIAQPAVAPGAPFSPRPIRTGILALFVALVLGFGLAFLLDYLDKRIKNVKALERAFGLPVLAIVPAVGRNRMGRRNGKRLSAAVGFAYHPSLLESFRALRSSLQFFNVGKDIQSILVTSGLPREGKTVTAVNLALSLALAGNRVVLLEADLRRPMVPDYLGVKNEVGLSTVLATGEGLADALQLVQLEAFAPRSIREKGDKVDGVSLQKNLYCLPSGPLPPNPAELLGSGRMEKLLRELQASHKVDYLVIDTPPLLPVADAMALAPFVDAVVIAARVNWTTGDEAQEVKERLNRSGARAIGLVVGGVKVTSGYYRRRGYGYGYG